MRRLVKELKQKKQKSYRINRHGSGYAIFDETGTRVSEENVWPVTMTNLERLLRKEAGI